MSTTQITGYQPKTCFRNVPQLHRLYSKPCVLPALPNRFPRSSLSPIVNASRRQQCVPVSKYQRSMPVCLFGGKGKMGGDNGGSPWNAFQNVMGRFKGKSVEDVLRQQIEKKEYVDDGGKGRKPPPGGGSGNGGDGSGGSEDEDLAGILDETVQVILATIGFIFLYIYIITGEEIARLAKDYIKYLFGGSQSARLKRAMYKWGRFYKRMTEKKVG
uniref:Glycine-rich protein n=1 Tax=Fagus sylvatica TaxID=28930 RepID=A0A2N9IVN8_FAGSY